MQIALYKCWFIIIIIIIESFPFLASTVTLSQVLFVCQTFISTYQNVL